ncbi:hypothetical protein Sdel_0458 [Sulfurospirillum deleyianum DSM 6946]|uniref:Uncharacterized protein n=1 Tax=Sulfurospirillum deleyianum (strain ATCC 51133 / DSM 6946 / 5175) TaxID=525898 RepID=D1AZM8_SULD5|nr:hypothetical protein Sdel_0458 [Sulfurospirillum deleyianum DSM 6946]
MGNVFSFLMTLVLFGVASIFIVASSVVLEYVLPLLLFCGLVLGLILHIVDKNKK